MVKRHPAVFCRDNPVLTGKDGSHIIAQTWVVLHQQHHRPLGVSSNNKRRNFHKIRFLHFSLRLINCLAYFGLNVGQLFRRKDEAAKIIPDELVDDSAIVGDLDYVRKQIPIWEAAGVTMMVIGARDVEQIKQAASLL